MIIIDVYITFLVEIRKCIYNIEKKEKENKKFVIVEYKKE
jgi:hypothetical protein